MLPHDMIFTVYSDAAVNILRLKTKKMVITNARHTEASRLPAGCSAKATAEMHNGFFPNPPYSRRLHVGCVKATGENSSSSSEGARWAKDVPSGGSLQRCKCSKLSPPRAGFYGWRGAIPLLHIIPRLRTA